MFIVAAVAFTVLMTWAFQGARGSLLIAALGHAMFNLCTDLTTMPLASAAVLVLAALVVVVKDGAMRARMRTTSDKGMEAAIVAPRRNARALPVNL